MKSDSNKMGHKASWIVFVALASWASGCGDGFFHKPGGIFDAVLSRQVGARMAGGDVELLEYTGCKVVQSDDPKARCQSVSETQIEVFVDGRSLIFDFSNVSKTGRISEGEFEGYVLVVDEASGLPPILDAIVDAVKSSPGSENLDVQFDDKSVVVNLQGLDYDGDTFIKVDLMFDQES